MEETIQELVDIKIKALKALSKSPKNKELKELIEILDEGITLFKKFEWEVVSMDLETKVKILKENGFEECGDRRMDLHIDSRPRSEETKMELKKIIDESSFLVRSNEKGEPTHWYSEEYIRNTDIDKILDPFNSEENNDPEIEWID